MKTEIVTEEEMRALMPAYEVEDEYLDRIRKKIFMRIAIIVVLFVVRLLMIISYPEFHISAFFQDDQVEGSLQIENIMLFRMSVLIPFSVIYFVSFWKNLYFRTVTVVSLIIVSSILWSDMEKYLGSFLSEATALVWVTLAIRVTCLWLLILNYIDVRR
ncbi:MAG: hypothetical protein OSB20_11020 [Porticoccaceae bacterium]|nr:hypothetical protein [Porticoccaceae bacterium]